MTTSRSGAALRVTFTVTPLPSDTVYESCSKLAVTGLSSSSVIVRVTSSGSVTPVSFVAEPFTVTWRSPL